MKPARWISLLVVLLSTPASAASITAAWPYGAWFIIEAYDGYTYDYDVNRPELWAWPTPTATIDADITGTQGTIDPDYIVSGSIVLESNGFSVTSGPGTYSGRVSTIEIDSYRVEYVGNPLGLIPVDRNFKRSEVSFVFSVSGLWHFGEDTLPFTMSKRLVGGMTGRHGDTRTADSYEYEPGGPPELATSWAIGAYDLPNNASLASLRVGEITYTAAIGNPAWSLKAIFAPEPDTAALIVLGLLAMASARNANRARSAHRAPEASA